MVPKYIIISTFMLKLCFMAFAQLKTLFFFLICDDVYEQIYLYYPVSTLEIMKIQKRELIVTI